MRRAHYNVGQQALFQKAQQLVIEEARIGSQQADLFALSPQRESFFEKLLYAPAGSAVAAAEPAVEEKVRFAQYGQQWMVAGPSVFARVVSLERTLLLTVTLKHRRIQIQGVAVLALRQTLHLPFGQRFVEALDLAHAERTK